MFPFIVFVGVCVLNFVLAIGLKEIGKLLFRKEYHHYVCEFCCSFIVVANVYENGNIIAEYGVSSFAVTLFALILIYMHIFDASASPISIFDEVWNRKRPVGDGALTMVFQVAGACLGARFMVYLWGSLQLTDQHVSKAEFLSKTCQSTNQVTIWEGFAVEMLFTMILRIVASYSSGIWLERSLNSFASVAVVVIGLDWTGSMINPALATAMTYNCENHPFYEHLLVYWVAPFTGSILSDYVEDYLHGAGWRDKDQVSGEEQQAVKTNRKRKTKRKSSRSKKSSWDQTALSVNNVSPKKRKQKEANSNSSSQRKVNVGGN